MVEERWIDTIPSGMQKVDFIEELRRRITPEDREILGDNCMEQMVEAVLYPSAAAPYPATFDSSMIAGVIDDVGSGDLYKTTDMGSDLVHAGIVIRRTDHLVNRVMELGVIEMDRNGRFFIMPEVAEKLGSILDQFDGNEEL